MTTMATTGGGGDTSSSARAILLLSTTEDMASVNLVNALLHRGGWEEHEVPALGTEGRVWRRTDAPQPLYLWQIQKSFLRSDFLDRQWTAATNQQLQGTYAPSSWQSDCVVLCCLVLCSLNIDQSINRPINQTVDK
jgi:hypothetical protein